MSKRRILPASLAMWLGVVITFAAAAEPDDPAAHKALVKVGGWIHWDADGNVWKAEFAGTPITDDDLKHVKSLHQIQRLDLRGTKITDAGLAEIRGKNNLRVLDLSKTMVTDAGMVHLGKLPNLESLDLSQTSVSGAGLVHLKQIKTLELLDLNHTAVSGAGLVHLKQIQSLESLDLNGARVTDAGLEHLRALPRLRRLALRQYAVKSFAIDPEAKPNVTTRRPTETAITDAGLVHLSRVPSLEHLEISGSAVTNAGLAHLKKLPKLEYLFLERTQIGDAGLAQLAGLKTLQWIWLSETRVTDAGLVHLKDLKNLEMLILDKTKVTNAGLKHLEGLTKLDHLSLTGTAVNKEGADKLQAASNIIHFFYDRPPFDSVGAKAANKILELVKAGDLEGFKAEFAKNPDVVNFRWTNISKVDNDGDLSALHFAARRGDLPMLRFLLKHGAEVNAGNWRGTPLHCAANIQIATALLSAGADVKSVVARGNTPLHYAASNQIAAAILAAGADVHAKGDQGMTPLHYAANRGVAEVLLEHGAEVDCHAHVIGRQPEDKKWEGPTPLATAAGDGQLDVVKLLIEHGADVNATDDGAAPIFWATYHGHADVVKLLLANGVRVNGFDPLNRPLDIAIQERRTQIVRQLLKAGAKLPQTEKSGRSVLHTAVLWDCDGELIELLINAGAAVDAKTEDRESPSYSETIPPYERPPITGKRTPLHLAIERGNLSAAKVLIAHGADVGAVTTDGETPLSLTRRVSKVEILPFVQGTVESVNLYHEKRRKERETANANRKKIAELIRRANRKR